MPGEMGIVDSPTGDLTVVATAPARRLDQFLAAALPSYSRARLQHFIATGCVSCNGIPVHNAASPVAAGARFLIQPPPVLPAQPLAQPIPLDILYEDAALIVLDKPAGLVVHPAPGSPDHTLVNALLAHCGESLPGIGGERRPGIVHRLDKNTSGLMVVAKSEAALTRLSAAFAARDLDRAYLALAWGLPTPPAGSIDGPIGRDPRDRKRMALVRQGGKPALTHYTTLRHWHAAVSLLRCQLATGRTHQIRVHLAARAHPLVGDPVYLRRVPAAARALPAAPRATLLDFPRQALHAAVLGFHHPITGVALRFERQPPDDFQSLLRQLDTGTAGP